MTALVPGTCDPALAPGAPEWVQLFPDGPINGRDGRSWELPDPDAPVAAFQSGSIDLPVDFGHANDNPDARLNGPVPAAGWIKELRADAGLWGLGAVDRHGGRDDRQPRISLPFAQASCSTPKPARSSS